MKALLLLSGFFYAGVAAGQTFTPDTTVNNICLERGESITTKFKTDALKVRNRLAETRDAAFPYVDFQNKSGDQVLILIFHPGNWTNAFSEFKVQYADGYKEKNRSVELLDEEFATEKGITLGTTKSELLQKIGKPTSIRNENGLEIIEYRTTDENSEILRRYRQVEYFAVYKLKEGIVNEFHFGFVYP